MSAIKQLVQMASRTLTLLVLAILTVSCEPDSSQRIASPSENPESSAESRLQPYPIVMLFPSHNVPKDLPLVQNEINAYLRQKLNATLELRPIEWSEWQSKTNYLFVSNQPFDLIFTSSWLYLGEKVNKRQIIPLDNLVKQYGSSIRKTLPAEYLDSGRVNGAIYGIVTNKEFASTKGLFLRKDIVDKYGFDLSSVKKLEDMEPILRTVKEQEPGLVPLQVKYDRSPLTTLLGYGEFDMLDFGTGPGVLNRQDRNLKVVNMYETPEYLRYAKLMHRWFKLGYINADGAITRQDEHEAVKSGLAFAYAESIKPGAQLQESRITGYAMAAVELTQPYTTTGDTTSAMFAVSRTSANPERAMMLLDLLYGDKYLINLLNWGIEGTHYIKKSENVIDYPSGVNALNVGYNLNIPWMFGNQFNSYTWVNEDPNLWDQYRRFNTSAEKSPALGFLFNPESVKYEVAACNSVIQQYTGALNAGEFDPDVMLPRFIEALKGAGMDKVIEEKQRQLDEWAKNR
ncbi:ABC transporter substrate-binding protein [Paenibacillus filicis]|uniref:ABC transporter substrate-binding protein n=1 Tax=Paenibacillus filicis TaxID=669464 RepID=A0ABU9DM46_9BACL